MRRGGVLWTMPVEEILPHQSSSSQPNRHSGGAPLWGWVGLSILFTLICVFFCLQVYDSKWFIGKYLEKRAAAFSRDFLSIFGADGAAKLLLLLSIFSLV